MDSDTFFEVAEESFELVDGGWDGCSWNVFVSKKPMEVFLQGSCRRAEALMCIFSYRIAFLQKILVLMFPAVKSLHKLLRLRLAKPAHQGLQLLSAAGGWAVSDVPANDGFLVEKAHLDGNMAEQLADGFIIAAPAVDGDAFDPPSLSQQRMDSRTQCVDALGFDLTKPDNAPRIMEAEIAILTAKEARIHKQVDGFNGSSPPQSFRKLQPVEMFLQRGIADAKTDCYLCQRAAAMQPVQIMPAVIDTAATPPIQPLVVALFAEIALSMVLVTILFYRPRMAGRTAFLLINIQKSKKITCFYRTIKTIELKTASHFFNYAIVD